MFVICKDSHLDHGLTTAQLRWLLEQFGDRDAEFTETVDLPWELGPIPCALWGPVMGDKPVLTGTIPKRRGGRLWFSRFVARDMRPGQQVTIIAGPHEGLPCVLYTVFGGPLAPQEPGDPALKPEDRPAAEAFWSEHALSYQTWSPSKEEIEADGECDCGCYRGPGGGMSARCANPDADCCSPTRADP